MVVCLDSVLLWCVVQVVQLFYVANFCTQTAVQLSAVFPLLGCCCSNLCFSACVLACIADVLHPAAVFDLEGQML